MTAWTLIPPASASGLKAVVERRMRENRTSGVARGQGDFGRPALLDRLCVEKNGPTIRLVPR
jgi:hypothetical protein